MNALAPSAALTAALEATVPAVFSSLKIPLEVAASVEPVADALVASIALGPGRPRLVLALDPVLAAAVVRSLTGVAPSPTDRALLSDGAMEAANLVAGRAVGTLGSSSGFKLGLPVRGTPTPALWRAAFEGEGRLLVTLAAGEA
jgi:hypothetical protein